MLNCGKELKQEPDALEPESAPRKGFDMERLRRLKDAGFFQNSMAKEIELDDKRQAENQQLKDLEDVVDSLLEQVKILVNKIEEQFEDELAEDQDVLSKIADIKLEAFSDL